MTRVGDARRRPGYVELRVMTILSRRPTRLVTIAMANKTRRIIWAVLNRHEFNQGPQAIAA